MKPVFKGSKQKEWQYKIVQDSWYQGKAYCIPRMVTIQQVDYRIKN
jgi:hypothetical protein